MVAPSNDHFFNKAEITPFRTTPVGCGVGHYFPFNGVPDIPVLQFPNELRELSFLLVLLVVEGLQVVSISRLE